MLPVRQTAFDDSASRFLWEALQQRQRRARRPPGGHQRHGELAFELMLPQLGVEFRPMLRRQSPNLCLERHGLPVESNKLPLGVVNRLLTLWYEPLFEPQIRERLASVKVVRQARRVVGQTVKLNAQQVALMVKVAKPPRPLPELAQCL